MRFLAFLFFIFLKITQINCQTLGGSSTYQFLKMQWVPQASALGGKNISTFNNDAALFNDNPALLRLHHHGQISANFTSIASTIKGLYGAGAYYHDKWKTTFGMGIAHLLYGNEIQTDAAGNIFGNFIAFDQSIAFAASRTYGEKWFYGAAFKYINSRIGAYSSSGVAADFGLNFYDKQSKVQAGFVAKNMGFQIKTYSNQREDLPFDLVLGITKQLEKAPLRFSLTAQRLHQFDISYNDVSFDYDNFGNSNTNRFFAKFMSHFIAGTDLLIGEKVVVSVGYNFLRRNELLIRNVANGLTGFGYGIALNFNKFKFQYARTHYQLNYSLHQVSFNYRMIDYEK